MSVNRVFVDTNILIYAYSSDNPTKQKVALTYLDKCIPVISTQVVKEFSNVLLKRENIDVDALRDIIIELTEVSETTGVDIEQILSALELKKRYQYSFYDCLVISAALDSNCKVLLSEDMQNGQIIGGKLQIMNPFAN